jgi:hypothetical protein
MIVWHCMSDMTTVQISTRRFTKEFRTLRNRPLQVTDRGKVLGTWTSAPSKSVPVDFEERARKDSSGAMPVSFAALLRERETAVIYCDSSFSASLYALDGNTVRANRIYQADGRRPLLFSEWQELELINTLRLGLFRARRAKTPTPYVLGNCRKRIAEDLRNGILCRVKLNWRRCARRAAKIGEQTTETLGVSCWTSGTWHARLNFRTRPSGRLKPTRENSLGSRVNLNRLSVLRGEITLCFCSRSENRPVAGNGAGKGNRTIVINILAPTVPFPIPTPLRSLCPGESCHL